MVGLGAGITVGVMIGRQQKTPTKIVKQSSADGVNIGDVRIEPAKDLADNLASLPDASTYLNLFETAGMKDYLHNVGPYTVLLPLNNVFSGLNQNELTALQSKANQPKLKQLLMANMINGTVTAAQIRVMAANNQTIKNMNGDNLQLKIDDKKLEVVDPQGNVSILNPTDAITANGVIQVSSQVMVPKNIKLTLNKS